jgi:hypothetical protein
VSDSRGRFSWNDDDVELRDDKGKVLSPREVLEQQLEQLRAEAQQETDNQDE